MCLSTCTCSKVNVPLYRSSADIKFAVVAIINWKSSSSAFSQINGNLVHGHVAVITETKYRYIMIESILWFDGTRPSLAFLLQFKGQVCSQESRAEDGLGMGYYYTFVTLLFSHLLSWWNYEFVWEEFFHSFWNELSNGSGLVEKGGKWERGRMDKGEKESKGVRDIT